MASGGFVAYYRVSTARQGASGLGLDAQRKSVTDYLNGGRWTIAAEFVEVESGKNDDRPQLAAAIAACRVYGSKLVIAKLDRLSRDIHFLTGLQKAGVKFVAADMPEANELVVHIMAAVAQAERKMISERTKAALQAAKARGTKLGGKRLGVVMTAAKGTAGRLTSTQRAKARAADLGPTIDSMMAEGISSATGLAKALTAAGIPTTRGGVVWSAVQVQRLLTARNH